MRNTNPPQQSALLQHSVAIPKKSDLLEGTHGSSNGQDFATPRRLCRDCGNREKIQRAIVGDPVDTSKLCMR